MRRVNVVGVSGSGKSTLGRELAGRLGVPHVELDGIHHLPGWEPIGLEAFRQEVGAAVGGDGWVVDGNYSGVRDLVWAAADTVVFLDLPRWRTTCRVLRRSLLRVVTREELWNGNREEWQNLLSRDFERNVVLWSWVTHARRRAEFAAAERDPRWGHVRFVRLRNPQQVAAFLSWAG